MNTFPSMSHDWLMWHQSFFQVMDWFDRAQEIRSGEINELDDMDEFERPDDDFVWNEKEGRYE